MNRLSYIQANTRTSLSCLILGLIPLFIIVPLCLIFNINNGYSAQVTLGWDPNTDPDLAGYKIYYGTSSRNYTRSVNLTSPYVTAWTISDLTEGQTYYFAATAYNTGLVESNYSAEVFSTITPATTTTTVQPTTSTSTSSIIPTTSVPTTTTTVRPTTSTSTSSIVSTTSISTTTTTVRPTTSSTSAPQTTSTTSTTANTSCTYSLSPTSSSFKSSGGTGRVSVSTQSVCAWTATSNVSWIKITSKSSGNGSMTVSYSVAFNTSKTTRTGTMKVAGKTFTVQQTGRQR